MKNILWILKDIPCAGGFSAGNLRLYNLLSYLAKTGQFNIHVRGMSANYGMGDLKKLNINTDYNQTIKKVIDLKFKPDIIIVSWYSILIDLYDFFKYQFKDVPIICDTVDVNFSRLKSEGDRLFDYEKQRELNIYKKADKVLVVSESDQLKLKKYNIDSNIVSCCYQYSDNIINYSQINKKSLSFQGFFLHRPNINAAFKSLKIFSNLIMKEPNANLYMAGKNPPAHLIEVAKKINNAHICGIVYDFNKFMSKIEVCVAPLTYQSGVSGKTLFALHFGIPIIVSSIVKDGIPELKNLHNCLLFDIINIDGFVNGILKIFNDQELRIHLIMNGKQLIKDNYSIKVVGNNLVKILNNF